MLPLRCRLERFSLAGAAQAVGRYSRRPEGSAVPRSGLRISLLSGFRVSVGEQAVGAEAWRRRKPASLLKILALAPAHRVHREQLMELLWPDVRLSAAGANLRKAIHQARSALDGAAHGASRLIEFSNDVVSLATDDLVIDVEVFRSELALARRGGDVNRYRKAVELYGNGLLPDDRYEEWAIGPQRQLQTDYLAGLSEMCQLLEAAGDIAGAIDTARSAVAAEPTREESHATLMHLYALAGQRVDALRQYDYMVEVLDDELGVEPGPEVQQLREEINARKTDEPELSAELWERVGDLRVLSGDGMGAARAFGSALDSSAPSRDAARLERKCAEAWLMQHQPDVAAGHLANAESHPTDAAERGRLLRAKANLAWETGLISVARQFAEESRDVAIEHGTSDDLAAAREAVAIVSHFEGAWRQGLESELERLATADTDGAQLARVFDIHHCIGQYHLYGDGLSESVEGYARQILDRAEAVGAVRAQAFAWCLLGESLLLGARWEESDGCLERSCDLHTSLGSRSGALAWQRRAELAACRGNLDEADTYLTRASGIATVSAMASHVWGRIYATTAFTCLQRGQPALGTQAVQAAAAAAARYGDCPTCSALLNPVAAEAYAKLGDRDNARYYRDAADRVANFFASSAWTAMAESACGSLSSAEGDGSAARKHFDRARQLYEHAGQPFWADRSARFAAAR
jgi:DNA-binding SARP family transcriptional activator